MFKISLSTAAVALLAYASFDAKNVFVAAQPRPPRDGGCHGGPRGPPGVRGPGLFGPPGLGDLFITTECVNELEMPVCAPLGSKAHFESEESGIFVCRTVYHPVTGASETITACIASDEGFTTDECGCCGDCPAVCQCPCTHENPRNGTEVPGVLILTSDQDSEGTVEKCVPLDVAVSLVARNIDGETECAIC